MLCCIDLALSNFIVFFQDVRIFFFIVVEKIDG